MNTPNTPAADVAALDDLTLFRQLACAKRWENLFDGEPQAIASQYREELADEAKRRAGCDGTEPARGFAVQFWEASNT